MKDMDTQDSSLRAGTKPGTGGTSEFEGSGQNASGASVNLTQLTGFIGFLAASTMFFFLMFRSPLSSQRLAGFISLDILLIVVLGLGLFSLSALNNKLISPKGTDVLYAASALFTVAGVASMLLPPLLYLAPVLLALGLTPFVIIWGMYLATLSHNILVIFSSITVLFISVLCVSMLGLDEYMVAALVGVFFVVSWVCGFIIRKYLLQHTSLVSNEVSRQRSAEMHGNKATLLTVGLMIGSSGILLTQMEFGLLLSTLVMAASLMCAGLTLLLIRRHFQSSLEDVVRRSFAVSTTTCLLPIPFVSLEAKAVLVGLFLAVAVVSSILIVDAMAETARFSQLSPIWLIGHEGGFYMLGAVVGSLLFSVTLTQSAAVLPLAAATIIAAMVVSVAQLFITKPEYPFPGELTNSGIDKSQHDRIEELLTSARGGAIWHAKIKVVSHKYGLSPRQQEIMELLAKGRNSRFIMNHFFISRSTAKTHIYNLYRKVDIHSRQDLLDLIEQTYVTTEDIKDAAERI